jgi:hypothetical protein
MQEHNFNQLSLTWKALIVIGSISSIIFLILLVIIVSLMFESKLIKKEQEHDLSKYDDFLNEFANGKISNNKEEYPILPKIKDFEGNYLKNLMQIDIL